VLNTSKATVVFFSKKRYSHYLELIGSRNGIERDFTIKNKNNTKTKWGS